MATTTESKLKKLYSHLAAGTPLSSKDLAALGISADLAVHYVRAGWLERLARGVSSQPGEALSLHASLLLERRVEGLHVGGKSALSWYNVRHYVAQQETLHLYGWAATALPSSFEQRFPSEYLGKRLFKEEPSALRHVTPFENRAGAPKVSSPERALLKLLSEVGVRQPLQEARELMESTYTFRADVLHDLLESCTSVKTVRLCLQLGRELSLPWVKNSMRRNCLPGANATGYRGPITACWCSNHEPGLSRYGTIDDADCPAGICGGCVRLKGRHRHQSFHTRHAASFSRSRSYLSRLHLAARPGFESDHKGTPRVGEALGIRPRTRCRFEEL
jgi:hypothetical protein